ncbi:hypothetical protein [Spirilliplanes yamanashiensis]|uniref:Uncharacterized protein n=1 Tax=Spirilliplanes yamanashiensis TaxID=42233 RepID=A0A8J3YCQ2_9ACTN|nr:hypothetical protein [Spirilliplanes yamanashiensis]MDP9818903.1 hypothetical protein [Spirilliplanes yamanashiensis]GIJ05357.1 hypothetical protein Sya03_47090 [Spirilliplanes yamanashiensis]
MRPLTTFALAGALVLGLATPAAAAGTAAGHGVDIRGVAACDHDTREWVITWTVRNLTDVAGTIGNVRVDPPGRPLVALPQRVDAGATATGTQRLLASEYTARVQLDVNWDDGPVTYDHHWPVYIKAYCH